MKHHAQPTSGLSKELHPAGIPAHGPELSHVLNEAARCLLCHEAPCSKACPAATDPATFIRKLRLRNVKGAIRTIKENNILGGICALVCPTEQLCQKGCVAAGLDRPIDIALIQRHLVEQGWRIGFDPLTRGPAREGKVAVIGSGPAGLACAAEVARQGFQVEVFESQEEPGGVLRYGVPSFRLPPEFLDRELEDLRKLGVKISCGRKIEAGGAEKLLARKFQAVFVAPGTWRPIGLDLPGFDLPQVVTARDFLCAMRSGATARMARLIKGKNVAVYGGGSVAMDAATTAAALGANKVYLLYRRSLREMPATRHDLDMALANNVHLRTMSIITRLIGEKGRLVALEGQETDWRTPGDTTAANLIPVPGTSFTLRIDAFIPALGYQPEEECRAICAGVKVSRKGLIETKRDGVSTSHPRIFAGGDIVRGPALVVEAVADGKAAGQQIVRLLSENTHRGKGPSEGTKRQKPRVFSGRAAPVARGRKGGN
ncbi:MAG: FAD-dependent oxidoreductase [Polyangia bacterium]|jgi:NADPH-dependent glutamate synthase beta subunit-like oxidoreductase|nr:FAD-dependent oxidoreductase [Polyangia bacterium]